MNSKSLNVSSWVLLKNIITTFFFQNWYLILPKTNGIWYTSWYTEDKNKFVHFSVTQVLVFLASLNKEKKNARMELITGFVSFIATLYTSCILLGIFLNSSVPIFFELFVETVYPVPEGITCGVVTFLSNVFMGVLLFFLTFYHTGKKYKLLWNYISPKRPGFALTISVKHQMFESPYVL